MCIRDSAPRWILPARPSRPVSSRLPFVWSCVPWPKRAAHWMDGGTSPAGSDRRPGWMEWIDPHLQLSSRSVGSVPGLRQMELGRLSAALGPLDALSVGGLWPARNRPRRSTYPVGLTAQTGRAWSHPELHCLQLRCAVRVSPDHPIPAGAGSRAIYHSVHGPVPSPTRPPPPPPPLPPSCRNAGHPRQPVDRRSSSRHAGSPSSCDATRSDIATTVTHQHHHYHHQSIAATARSAASSRGKRLPPPLQEAAAASFLGVPVAGQARAGAA